MSKNREILIVAGEASGDRHAAKLVTALRDADADLSFFGSAGPLMRGAGVEPIVEADRLSIVGLAEIGRALPMFLEARRELIAAVEERKPELAILVDFPEFNLKLARSLKRRGIRVVYYISPQLWAWREYRVRTIRNYVDLLITILPFEKDWYAARGIDHVEYVGNPLAREVHANQTREEFCGAHGLGAARPVVSLLPGSRHKEIVRILPVMIDCVRIMSRAKPDIQFVIAAASESAREDITEVLRGSGEPDNITIVTSETYEALNASDAAVVTSGTATLEAGIIGTPMVIVYRTSWLNYTLFEPMISVEHYGLINLIARERVAKELIQDDLNASALTEEIERLLQPDVNAAVRSKLKRATEKLGAGGASKRAADAVLRLIGS